MRFNGTEQDLINLKAVHDNILEAILINAFNAGYDACNTAVTNYYKQAEAAVEQGLIDQVPAGQNFIIALLQKANSIREIPSEVK